MSGCGLQSAIEYTFFDERDVNVSAAPRARNEMKRRKKPLSNIVAIYFRFSSAILGTEKGSSCFLEYRRLRTKLQHYQTIKGSNMLL